MHEFDAKARGWDHEPANVARARKVAELIAGRVPGLAGARVLEVGAGTGLLGFALRDRARHATLVDGSAEMVAVAGEKMRAQGASNVDVVQRDVEREPLPGARYDVVCALLILHHVRDTEALLRKLHGALEPGGHLCVSDLDAEDGSFHGGDFAGHQGFDRATLAAQLGRAGFDEVRFEDAFAIEKPVAGGAMRRFGAFLAVARKPPPT